MEMYKFIGFTDLCVPEAKVERLKITLQEVIDLGYHNVAIDQTLDLTKTDCISMKQDAVPAPYCLKELMAFFGGQIRLLNRLTVIFSDSSVTFVLNKSNNIRSFNLIAALPTNESSFQYACQTMACDIITYSSNTNRFKINRKFYFLAVERNIGFELKYAPAIISSQDRKATITRAHRYHSFGKSKNVVISSEARNAFQLRSPYDIANLGLILGLSEEQSKQAIRDVPNRILLSAEGRRYGKAGVFIFRNRRKGNVVDSDDYSDTELEEEISDEDGDTNEDDLEMEDQIIGKEENFDDTEEMQPPKKVAKR